MARKLPPSQRPERWHGLKISRPATKPYDPDATWKIQVSEDAPTDKPLGMDKEAIRQLVLYSASRTHDEAKASNEAQTVSAYGNGPDDIVVMLHHIKHEAVVARRRTFDAAGLGTEIPRSQPRVIRGQDACRAFLQSLADAMPDPNKSF